MSGPHFNKNVATDSDCHSTARELGVSSQNNEKKNVSQDLRHTCCCTESMQSSPLYNNTCSKVSEECHLSPEILNLMMCNGIDHYMNLSEASKQVDGYDALNMDMSEHFNQQLNLNVGDVANKLNVSEDRSLCAPTVDSCLQIPSEIDSQSDHGVSSLVRSNSFTQTSSADQLDVLCTATRKLTSSPKPVLRRHSMTFSRTKKQVTIEANAKVIEIDTGTSECPEIESGVITASAVDSAADCTITSASDFSPMYIGTVKCLEKPSVRRLVEEDDDSCGDEADDESTANEEELETECKEEREHKRKRRKSVEDEIEKVVSSSPNGRFLKFDWEIGCGSFKTVYKGLDSETGVHVAWCELQVCKFKFNFTLSL